VPRRSKGPRLWLRPARPGRESSWLIVDGTRQRGTGCSPSDVNGAEKALAAYLAEKHTTEATAGSRDPSQIWIDDVLVLYVQRVVEKHARPEETKARIKFLRTFWGGRRLSVVNGNECEAYADQRSTPGAARRELEDLRAAINYHRKRGLHDRIISVVLPPKAPARERWMTRGEAAFLILCAWRYREKQNLRATDRRTRKHVARFMVVARYMGSRASVICSASMEPERPRDRAWVDLDNGVFYGRPVAHRDTKKRRQTVRIPPRLLAHMRPWRAAGQRYVVEWNGEPIKRITKAHNAAVAAAGLGSDVTPHTWRHSLATWMMQAGAEPFQSAGFLGMSLETLLRTYGHHHPAHSAGVHAAIDRHRDVGQSPAKDKSEQKAIPANRRA
jgi:integrase